MDEPVHQCPYCELRFAYHNEIKDHVLHDTHPDRAEAFANIELHELPHWVHPAIPAPVEPMAGAGAAPPSPVDNATAPVATPASERELAGEAVWIAKLDHQCRRGDRSNAGLVAHGGAVLIEQPGRLALEPADLCQRLAIVINCCLGTPQRADRRRARKIGADGNGVRRSPLIRSGGDAPPTEGGQVYCAVTGRRASGRLGGGGTRRARRGTSRR